jgi:hypothetical protein
MGSFLVEGGMDGTAPQPGAAGEQPEGGQLQGERKAALAERRKLQEQRGDYRPGDLARARRPP